jgi:hypothetical protein
MKGLYTTVWVTAEGTTLARQILCSVIACFLIVLAGFLLYRRRFAKPETQKAVSLQPQTLKSLLLYRRRFAKPETQKGVNPQP